MTAYYNENDPRAAAWLRELIKQGHIVDGEVDERSILEVPASDLKDFTQVHLFAGIGGWSFALRLAGWPDDHPVWTGSCPCQPFSVAGKGKGKKDERHLWPEMLRLVTECSPPVVFGEQVASKAGRGWLSGVRTDLEALGYGVGAADLCAAGVGAPHVRQRLWWVADSQSQRLDGREDSAGETGRRGTQDGAARRVEDAKIQRLQGWGDGDDGLQEEAGGLLPPGSVLHAGWEDSDVIPCSDGKARRVEAGTFPLADGVPDRVGLLRGYGNAIVPQVAATFIGAFVEAKTS